MFAAMKEARERTVSLTDKRGMNFTRLAIAKGLGGSEPAVGARIAAQRWGEKSLAHEMLTKTNIPAAGTGSTSHGSPLVSPESGMTEFFNLVMEQSVLGRMKGIRRLPFNTPTLAQYSGATGAFIGQGAPVPVSRFVVERFPGLETWKCSAISVATRELLMTSEAEEFIRTDLIRAATAAIDTALLDPANSGTPDVKPASILSGVTESGAASSPIDIEDDFREMIADFGGNLENAYWVFSPFTAALLHSPDHTEIGPRGGLFYGIPAITTRNAASGVVALIDPDAIALAMGGIELDSTDEGTLEQVDNPTNNSVVPTQTQHVSMFQTGSVAFKVTMTVNWRLARPDGAAWFGNFSSPFGAVYQR